MLHNHPASQLQAYYVYLYIFIFVDEAPAEETGVADLADKLDVLNIESGLEALVCKLCGAAYKKPWTLMTHMRKKHNEENSFSCDQCSLTFSDAKGFAVHAKSHERIFVCDICEEVFFDKSKLTVHKKKHLVCKICSRVCDNTYALTRHIRSHNV